MDSYNTQPVDNLHLYDFARHSNFNHTEALLIARTIVGLAPGYSRKRYYVSDEPRTYKVMISNYNDDFGERLRGKYVIVAPGLMYSITNNVFGTSFEVFIMTIREIVTNDNGSQTLKPTLRVSEGLFGTEFLKKLQYQARQEKLPIEMIDHHQMFPDL